MSDERTVIVLQARTGSRRLPGKVLRLIAGQSVLAHCLHRLLRAGMNGVVVATTAAGADDAVEAEARRLGVPVVRGPEDDVLARFVLAANRSGAQYLIRATADNPAVDFEAPGRLLRAMRPGRFDYAHEHGMPFGTAVEGIRADALRIAHSLAIDPADREHVTPFIRRHPDLFRARASLAPAALRRPDLRLTIDTPDDLAFMTEVLMRAGAGTDPVPLRTIICAADRVNRRAEVA